MTQNKIECYQVAIIGTRNINIGHTTNGDHSPISGDININKCITELEAAKLKISYLEQRIKDKEEIIEILKTRNLK